MKLLLDKKLELLSEKINELKRFQNKISFSKCEDKLNCTYCSYSTICDRE